MRPGHRLEEAGDPRPHRAGERPGDHRRDYVQDTGQARELGPHPDRHDRSDQVLALAADVEHPAAKRECDREPGEHKRHPGDERLLKVGCGERLEVVRLPGERNVGLRERQPDLVGPDLEEPVEPGALEDRLVGREGTLARGDEDNEATDEEGEDGRQQRYGEPAGPLPQGQPRRDAAGVVLALRYP